MQDNTLVMVALVGLALVCAGLFLFLGLTLFRVTGLRLLSYFSLFTRDAADERNAQPLAQSPTPDLRVIADAQDFDSALARHGAAPGHNIQPGAMRTPQTPPVDTTSPFDSGATPRLGSRRSTRPELRSDDDDADLFGGLLEDEDM